MRYRGFRPYCASLGQGSIQPSNYGTVFLYNDSTGPIVLVVRAWSYADPNASDYIQVGVYQGVEGTNSSTITRMVPTEAAANGQIWIYDSPTKFPYLVQGVTSQSIGAQTNGFPGYWAHNFPFLVLPPGWSQFIQYAIKGAIAQASFVWESIPIEDLVPEIEF